MIESDDMLRVRCRAAEREASAALVALSERMFIRPELHDRLRASEPFAHWRACCERARHLQEQLDGCTERRA